MAAPLLPNEPFRIEPTGVFRPQEPATLGTFARPEMAPGQGTQGQPPGYVPPAQQPKPPTAPTPTAGGGGVPGFPDFRPSGNPVSDLRYFFNKVSPNNQGFQKLYNALKAAYPGRISDVGASARGVWDKIVIDGTTYDVIQNATGTSGTWMVMAEGPVGGGRGAFDVTGQVFEDPLSQAFMDAVRKRIGQLGTPAATPELDELMALLNQPAFGGMPSQPTNEGQATDVARWLARTVYNDPNPSAQFIQAVAVGLLHGGDTVESVFNRLTQQAVAQGITTEDEIRQRQSPFDALSSELRGALTPTDAFTELMALLEQRATSLGETPADIAGLQDAIALIEQQLGRATTPQDMQGLENLLGTLREQAGAAGQRPAEALAAERQLMDLLQGRINELGQGPTETVLAAQEAQAFDALAKSRDAALARLNEQAQARGIAPGSGVMLAAQAETERGFSEIQAQQQQALILRRHEEEQLRAQERIATAGDLATVTQMREQAELDRQELERNLLRQIDLLEEEQQARLDAQEDRARDLAIQRSELQRAMQDRIDARQREIIDVTGLRADLTDRERARQIGVAGQLFGLEELQQQARLSQAQQAAALEQVGIDRDNARLDQILQLEQIFPQMGADALNQALATLGLAPVQGSNIAQTLLGIGQQNISQQQQTNQWLAGLGEAIGSGFGNLFGGLSGFGQQQPAA